MTPDQIAEVRDYMIDHRGQFRTFADSDSDTINLFKSGEITLTDGGLGTTAKLQNEDVDVAWVAPDEGALSWICGFGISSEAAERRRGLRADQPLPVPRDAGGHRLAGLLDREPRGHAPDPQEDRGAADPANLESLIPEVEPAYQEEWDEAWQEIQVG